MTGKAGTVKTLRLGIEQRHHLIAEGRLVRSLGEIESGELGAKGVAIHGLQGLRFLSAFHQEVLRFCHLAKRVA
jgi:hypothetical protein